MIIELAELSIILRFLLCAFVIYLIKYLVHKLLKYIYTSNSTRAAIQTPPQVACEDDLISENDFAEEYNAPEEVSASASIESVKHVIETECIGFVPMEHLPADFSNAPTRTIYNLNFAKSFLKTDAVKPQEDDDFLHLLMNASKKANAVDPQEDDDFLHLLMNANKKTNAVKPQENNDFLHLLMNASKDAANSVITSLNDFLIAVEFDFHCEYVKTATSDSAREKYFSYLNNLLNGAKDKNASSDHQSMEFFANSLILWQGLDYYVDRVQSIGKDDAFREMTAKKLQYFRMLYRGVANYFAPKPNADIAKYAKVYGNVQYCNIIFDDVNFENIADSQVKSTSKLFEQEYHDGAISRGVYLDAMTILQIIVKIGADKFRAAMQYAVKNGISEPVNLSAVFPEEHEIALKLIADKVQKNIRLVDLCNYKSKQQDFEKECECVVHIVSDNETSACCEITDCTTEDADYVQLIVPPEIL